MKLRILSTFVVGTYETKQVHLLQLPSGDFIWIPKRLLYVNWNYSSLYIPNLGMQFYGYTKQDKEKKIKISGAQLQKEFACFGNIKAS
ncbi:hypothetical protein CYR83_09755 [Ligilactobacillus agilis]|uniref:Uncharacterized protein n=1 Tax=Ligilactobacillus agilis TaxID=1601 RepID=A0A2I2AAU1_9LACO|nr:hypothetical protein [Ligilactobacillus agilis]PLA76501.1 hypothetical protein CYR79_05605 [Ligilactobacillus agilis]PLA82308.1 hypothetical protein CYR83_09755 [Ligilactobacillus agilis]